MTREKTQGPSEQREIKAISKTANYPPEKDRLRFRPNDENLSDHGSEPFCRESLVALVDVLNISILHKFKFSLTQLLPRLAGIGNAYFVEMKWFQCMFHDGDDPPGGLRSYCLDNLGGELGSTFP